MNGQVIIRASFPQGWRGNKYDQDEKMPATDQQAARLTRAGVAYYDFEEEEQGLAKPTIDNSKKEIEEYLDENDIEYSEYKTKSELLELIDGD